MCGYVYVCGRTRHLDVAKKYVEYCRCCNERVRVRDKRWLIMMIRRDAAEVDKMYQ